ncbi:MAG: hypothetical protein J7545_11540 [Roseofilum sp. SBFL]|uniref:hypothetical protein n=1 Tax=unclassified Roseofilum TaxID=2620099 RepID=UPI001B134FE0|nr:MULTISPECIES: hypothetical protein [unclassified Roseofilum]MBP0013101.1 hypothetical protein [Roseofilum sp. SID3]MBP0023731.1 hypothetical protein [Roseofilum sp. SID2]MBP0036803.1 hypothetical protein [Roseofilum sp. SID1]MBP0042593.1 hypothetical protein [Roseofilum sp. SBFL]
MNTDLETLFAEAENRYLKPEELKGLTEYVESLPQRLETYSQIREKEVEIMQAVADQLPQYFPNTSVEDMERSIKNAMLMLRYCAMSMLINNDKLVQDRFVDWLSQSMAMYETQDFDKALYKLLNQQLMKSLKPEQIKLIKSPLILAQTQLLKSES